MIMDRDNIDIDKMMYLFNQIAMKEGYNIIVNEIDPLKFFTTKKKFFIMIDRLIDFYIETEEYEKCATLLQIKKQNGWVDPNSKKVLPK